MSVHSSVGTLVVGHHREMQINRMNDVESTRERYKHGLRILCKCIWGMKFLNELITRRASNRQKTRLHGCCSSYIVDWDSLNSLLSGDDDDDPRGVYTI